MFMKKLSDQELIDELRTRLEERQLSLNELTILSNQLLEVNKKLTESEAMKSHFLANIRNEIVNPFASILGISKHLAGIKDDWEKVSVFASMIHAEAFDLNFQFKNIFAAAEIESGNSTPEYAKVNIISLLNEITEEFNFLARSKKIGLIVDNRLDPLNSVWYFVTDPGKLELIISNLLRNALEFSYENNDIVLLIEYDEANDMFIVSVKDQGVGIEKNEQERIFDRFYKHSKNINSSNKGHGLGLSIVRHYVDLLGGTIDVDSELGHGSKFTIKLPPGNISSISGFSETSNEMFFDQSEKF